MNLKNTIDNTNKYTNDLKLAKQKINDRILSGGGTIANTISEVPEAIDKMLKVNYKKMATIKNLNVDLFENKESVIKLKNLAFRPSRFFITLRGVDANRDNRYETIDSLKGECAMSSSGATAVDINPYDIKYEHSTKSLKIKPETLGAINKVIEIIAIE